MTPLHCEEVPATTSRRRPRPQAPRAVTLRQPLFQCLAMTTASAVDRLNPQVPLDNSPKGLAAANLVPAGSMTTLWQSSVCAR
mmetsp:Transcript_24649/g.71270  ORF Transcript_24649/g.71270 Transcript_24649/m.71270 type:complete len:83 (+) Transcript_24649:85-333(+)